MALVPRSLTEAFEQLRRDATMVARRVAGKRSPPFTTRRPNEGTKHRADDAAARMTALLAPRTVRVARVIRETPDAVTLLFEDPLGAPFRFVPGQFFTLILPVGGEMLRRAYSVSSDAREPERVAVTVKRVAGGVVSNHVNDHVKEGDLIQVLGPSGSFVVPPVQAGAGSARHLVLLAGGSGITPMMSIARTVLGVELETRVTLVYGNRGEGDIIFRDAIEALARAHGPRFVVRYVLSDPPRGWTGGAGILEERILHAELDACGPIGDAHFVLCGPEPMMRAARTALRARGVSEDKILEERFNMPHLRARAAAAADAGPQVLTIRANGAGVREVYVAPEQTMLEAGLSAGIKMDYSCAMGGCAACKVRLCDGEVEMEEPNCLTAEERGQGYVLACVSRVRKPATIALASDPAYAAARKEAAE
ncbi:MAG: 2Fe-2S iron-sulfur cluster-binding protein [Polyangiaceae bacterium]